MASGESVPGESSGTTATRQNTRRAGRKAPDGVRAARAAVAALVVGLALGVAPHGVGLRRRLAFVGVGNGVANVEASTLLLSRTPEVCRGRVLATVNGMLRGSSLAAMVLGGLGGALLGPRSTFVAGGAP